MRTTGGTRRRERVKAIRYLHLYFDGSKTLHFSLRNVNHIFYTWIIASVHSIIVLNFQFLQFFFTKIVKKYLVSFNYAISLLINKC